jgi:hypothetical protein
MDASDNDSQLSLLSKTKSATNTFNDEQRTTRLFTRQATDGSLAAIDVSLQVENDVIDDFVRGQEANELLSRRGPQGVFGRRKGLCAALNMGVIAVIFAVLVGTTGFALRYSETHTSINRYLIASGMYGLATAIANYVAIHVLLKTMFLAKNERVLQLSVRDIVMNLVFSRDVVEAELATQARRALTTSSLHRTVREIVTGGAAQALIDSKISSLLLSPEGLLLAMVGVSEEQLRAALVPSVVQVLAEIAPIVEKEVTVDRFVSAEHIYDMLSTVVSSRVEALSVADLQSIVSGVLLPQLSFIVLWGCVVGMVLGVVSEAAQLSKFIGETPS